MSRPIWCGVGRGYVLSRSCLEMEEGTLTNSVFHEAANFNGLSRPRKFMAIPSIHVVMCHSDGIIPGKPLNGQETVNRWLRELSFKWPFLPLARSGLKGVQRGGRGRGGWVP